MKKVVALALSAVLSVSLLTACGNGGGATNSRTGDAAAGSASKDSLIIALTSEPTQLDPQYTTDTYASLIIQNTHDPLVRRTASGEMVPALAQSWEMAADGMSVTLKIRQGVQFQDGSPLTAEDVAFSLNRAKRMAQSATYTESFKEAVVVDEQTVRLDLLYPDVAVLPLLTQGNNCIVSKSIVEKVGDAEYTNHICGTGPYRLVEWQRGSKLILEANEDYWQGAPSIQNVEFRILKETNTAMVALETGDVDMVLNVGGLEVQTVKDNADLGYQEVSSTTTWCIGFNCSRSPLDSAALRKALVMAIDQDAIIQGAADGAGVPAANVMPAGTTGSPENPPKTPYDPEGARELLEEAGIAPGTVTIRLAVREDSTQKIGTIVEQQWKEIGVNTEVSVMERSALLNDMQAGNLDAYVVGDVALTMDASMQTATLDSSTIPYTNNCFYTNPEYDRLNAEQAAQFNDPAKRTEIITQMLEIEVEDAPRAPLYHPTANIAYQKDLNVTVSPFTEGYFVYDMSWN